MPNHGPIIQPSSEHTSATFAVNMTQLRSLLEEIIPPKYRIPGSSLTLSFQDSSTGPTHWVELALYGSMKPAILRVGWQSLPSEEKSGAEPT